MFVLVLMGNSGKSYIGRVVALPDRFTCYLVRSIQYPISHFHQFSVVSLEVIRISRFP